MISQMRTLLRVKQLKESQALREMQARRQKAEAARLETLQAEAAVRESERSYEAREDAIYAEILGEVIDQGDVDRTHARVVRLEKQHEALKNALERARHMQRRLQEEAEVAAAIYRSALKALDKFRIVTDDLVQSAEQMVEQREEGEVEELFAQPRKKIAEEAA